MARVIDTIPGCRSRIHTLRKAGHSYSEIARIINKEYGISVSHQTVSNSLSDLDISTGGIIDSRLQFIRWCYMELIRMLELYVKGYKDSEQLKKFYQDWKEKMKTVPEVDIETDYEIYKR